MKNFFILNVKRVNKLENIFWHDKTFQYQNEMILIFQQILLSRSIRFFFTGGKRKKSSNSNN